MVYVDKRITLAAFKQNLEPYVGVPSTQFKVFRVYANNQEFESVRLNETLSSFSDDNKVWTSSSRCIHLKHLYLDVKQKFHILLLLDFFVDNHSTWKSS